MKSKMWVVKCERLEELVEKKIDEVKWKRRKLEEEVRKLKEVEKVLEKVHWGMWKEVEEMIKEEEE